MLTELEKISDEEFISEIRATGLYDEAEEELRKRLKKPEIWSYTNITPQQAVEEFRNKLIEEIKENDRLKDTWYFGGDNDSKEIINETILSIINNTK